MCLITQGKCGNEYLFQCSGSFKKNSVTGFLYFLSLLLLLGLKLDLLIANKIGFKMPSASLLFRLACYLQTRHVSFARLASLYTCTGIDQIN